MQYEKFSIYKFAIDVRQLEIYVSFKYSQENISTKVCKEMVQDGGNGKCAIFGDSEANYLCKLIMKNCEINRKIILIILFHYQINTNPKL